MSDKARAIQQLESILNNLIRILFVTLVEGTI